MPAEAPSPYNPGDDSRIPRPFGRMWLLRRLARGGMGEVYLAGSGTIEGAERPCVVKIIRRDHATDRSFLARFLDEARVQAQLHHPGVAQVLEAAVDLGGEPYVVVEYVEGRSLGEVRARAARVGYRLTWADAVAIGAALAEALAHTHERTDVAGRPLGIVHRDLSPQNVMLGYGGDVKLIDFGTARAENRRCRTISGVVYAKPGYVAPEIANGRPGDFRVDLYALGVMIWELLAGRRFLSGDAAEHMAAVARGELTPPPIAATAGAPAELDEVLTKMFSFDPDARYSTSSKAVADITKVLSRAPSLPNGERGVRARVALLLSNLYPAEPSRSRAEFAQLMRIARAEQRTQASRTTTPVSSDAPDVMADPFPSKPPALEPAPAGPNQLPGTAYQIVREIGRGAMGIVYEAIHLELLRRVALKVLPKDCSGGGTAVEAFRREARTLARLSHPNLVAVHEFGRATDGRLYCAMELIKGETLEQRVRRIGALDWEEVVNVGIDACRGLEAAHAAGILHRDLTPSNLIVCEQETPAAGRDRRALVKLVDFGIADIRAEVTGTGKEAGNSQDEHAPSPVAGTTSKVWPPGASEAQPRTAVDPACGAASSERGKPAAQSLARAEDDDESGGDLADALAADESEREQAAASRKPVVGRGEQTKAALQARIAAAAASRECVKIVGTPEYMAPEQARGANVDARADLYALATVLYEACTGRLPHESNSLVGLIESKLLGSCPPMRPPGMHRPVPKALNRVIAKALAPDPSERHESATAMREALEAVWLANRQRPGRVRSRGRTAGMALSMAAAAVLAAAGGLAVWNVTPGSERPSSSGGTGFDRGPTSWVRGVLRREAVSAPEAKEEHAKHGGPLSVANSSALQAGNAQPASSLLPQGSQEAALPAAAAPSPTQAEPAMSAYPRPASSEPARMRDRPPRMLRTKVAASRGTAASPGPHVGNSRDGTLAVPAPDLSPYATTLAEAVTKLSDGEFARALDLFRVLASAYPSDLSALRGWVEAAMATREWSEAQKAAERWQLMDAGTEPRLYLARIQVQAGRTADAVVTLRALLESHPECDDARAMLRDQGAEFPGAAEGTRAATDRGRTSGLH